MAPSSQSEDVLDLEQVTLQEAPLPPPIQRVMDPGQLTCAAVLEDDDIWHLSSLASHCAHKNLIFLFVFPGFSDSEVAVMNPDAADLVDRLDLSVSSIDMTNTSLAMHEEKDGEISGVGELGQQHFMPVSWSVHVSIWQSEHRPCLCFLLYRGAGGQCAAFIVSGQPDWPTTAEPPGSHGPHFCSIFHWRFVRFRHPTSWTISSGPRVHRPPRLALRV